MNNHASWFDAHRDDYQRFYVEPSMRFVLAAGEILRPLAPDIRAEPRILGSIFRINRDTRFSKDKRPYKDHIDFWFWEGERKRAVSGFFLRVSRQLVGVGAGCHGFDRDALPVFKRALSDATSFRHLEAVAAQLVAQGYRLSGTATPTSRFLYVHVDLPPELALQASLVDACATHWTNLAPLHRWIVDHVQRPLNVPA